MILTIVSLGWIGFVEQYRWHDIEYLCTTLLLKTAIAPSEWIAYWIAEKVRTSMSEVSQQEGRWLWVE